MTKAPGGADREGLIAMQWAGSSAGADVARGLEALRAAVARQLLAVLTSGDRTPRLRELRLPALVIHGVDDPLVRVSGGRATAAAIPGAELVELDGMGHDLPRALWPQITDRIVALVERHQPERLAA